VIPVVDREPDVNARPSTPTLVRSIATDSATLVRKEVELARQEMVEAVVARLRAATALIVAGIVSLIAIVFGGASAASALDTVMEPWASRLVVAGGFVFLAAIAVVVGVARKAPPLAPDKTKETVKEDIEWAKTQLKR
jgi:actin-like ATPase involved in cell morphogenesis